MELAYATRFSYINLQLTNPQSCFVDVQIQQDSTLLGCRHQVTLIRHGICSGSFLVKCQRLDAAWAVLGHLEVLLQSM